MRTEPGDDWQPPERFYPLFDSYRWRKYLGRVDRHRKNAVQQGLGHHLCRSWNRPSRKRDEQLATLQVLMTVHFRGYLPRKIEFYVDNLIA